MKKALLGMFLGFLIVGGAQAQETDLFKVTAGNIACFDYYKFGSVQADLQPQLAQTVPGAPITFTGSIVNDNDYPLVDGKLFVKIFRNDDATFSQEDGNPVVDQFIIEENITLPAKGSREASYEWQVPNNALAGQYYAAYFFTTSDRYNLMGLAFTDDIVGSQASFAVTTDVTPQVIELQKSTTTLNGQDHKFAHFPLHFSAEEPVILKTTLSNASDQTKTVPLQWNQYAWDDQNEDNRRNTQTEVITLGPNETKEVAYEVQPQKDAIVYVVALTQDGESKSFLNVRYVKDGVPETRINFPSLTRFPLKVGEENTLFACAHSTNENVQRVDNSTLILTLKDRDGGVIHQYHYEGSITAGMGGFGEKFLPQKNYDFVKLEAQLFRDGSEMENVTVTYDCNQIDPNSCTPPETTDSESFFSKKMAVMMIGGGALLVLIALFFFFRRRPKTITYLLALMFGVSLLGAPEVEAKTVTYYGQELGSKSWGEGGPYCGQNCGGWTTYVGHLTYGLSAYIAGSNTLIPENTTVPSGTAIEFRPEFNSTYLDWFSTGGSLDSPYGIWTNNLASINGNNFGWAHLYPAVTYNHSGSTAGLSCNGSGSTCTVTTAGIIQTTVNYPATSWKSAFNHAVAGEITRTGTTPAQAITYPINVSPPTNQVPNAPTITGPTTGLTNVSHSFTVRASDPNGDTVRYGMDWDNNGSVDQWLPGSGFVASNTLQSVTRLWPSAGTYTFRALTQDNQGANSGWTNHTITLSPPAPPNPTVALQVNGSNGPITVPANSTLSMTWSSTNATACTASAYYGSPWGGAKATSGSESVAGTSTTQTYTLTCQNSAGVNASDSVQVNIQAAPPNPTANLRINNSDGPITVPANSTLNISWSSTNATTCTASSYAGSPWGGAKATVGTQNVTGTSTTQTYTLTCQNSVGANVSDSVQVNIAIPPLSANLTINGSDGPLNVALGSALNLSWSSVSATSCNAWGTGWGSGAAVAVNGTRALTATASDTYIVRCTNGSTTVTDSVQVILTNSLKVCQNSCSSGIQRGNASSTQSFTMARGGTQNLVACFNPSSSCNDGSGNVTGSTSWGEGGSNVVSLSGTNPKTVTANNVGTESISASYSSQTANMNVSVTCLPTVSCDNAPGRENYCQNETFSVDNGCGISINCSGVKTCNYNWTEVAP